MRGGGASWEVPHEGRRVGRCLMKDGHLLAKSKPKQETPIWLNLT